MQRTGPSEQNPAGDGQNHEWEDHEEGYEDGEGPFGSVAPLIEVGVVLEHGDVEHEHGCEGDVPGDEFYYAFARVGVFEDVFFDQGVAP